MFAELLTAVDLLMGAVQKTKSTDVRRQKVAKQLLKIYLDIDSTIQRGEEILSFLKGEKTEVFDLAYEKLAAQQKALERIIENLNHPTIASLLKLHLPESGRLKLISQVKGQHVGFYLSQLIEVNEIDKEIQKLQAKIEKKRKSQKDFFRYNNDIREKESELVNARLLKLREEFDIKRFNAEDLRLILSGREFDFLDTEPSYKKSVRVFATSKQIKEAKKALDEFRKLEEKLRLFLTQKFQLEDII